MAGIILLTIINALLFHQSVKILESFLHDVLKPNMTRLRNDEGVAGRCDREPDRQYYQGQLPQYLYGCKAVITQASDVIFSTQNTSGSIIFPN